MGNSDFINRDFGITEKEAASSGLSATDLDGGYRSMGISIIDRHYLPDHFQIVVEAGFEYFSGDIQDNHMMIFLGFWIFMVNCMQRQQTGFMKLGKNKAKVYVDDDVGVRFKDAAGTDEAKEELEEVINFLKEPERFTRIGGQIPRGILLVGPPGTGNTILLNMSNQGISRPPHHPGGWWGALQYSLFFLIFMLNPGINPDACL